MEHSERKIGSILVRNGALTEEHLPYILDQLQTKTERFGAFCVKEGLIREDDLAQALAEQYNLEYADLSEHRIDNGLLNDIPADLTHRFRFVPLARDGETLVIAVSDPTDILKLDELEFLLDRPIQLRIATDTAIDRLLKTGIGTARFLREVSEDFMLQLIKENDHGEEVLSVESISSDTSPIIKLVNTTILDALNRRASDIHIETTLDGVLIKYRIDGVLYPAGDPLDIHFQAPIISRLKVISELDISERRIPQDGRFKIRLGDKSIDFRVSIMPSVLGEDAVIRILDKEHLADRLNGLTLESLGINEREIQRLRKKIHEPYGMILVTGPTGSGKSTTLYAALTEIHTGEEKIITIEDPVEYMLHGILQIPVNEKKGLTFAKGLRSILRHDPDKIMIGEIRDSETAQIAVQSALTGHLVFTTVHANNVFDVIARFIHMGIEPYNFVASLNCVMAQRLVRRLCTACRRPVRYADEILAASGIAPESAGEHTLYEAQGCDKCNYTGYHGRAAIVELLDMTDAMRDLIIGRATATRLKQAARDAGIVFLRDAAIEKLFAGETTLKEINRVTFVE
ncbi:MAG TPA: ATPase, T2SS/T4P/T4SS family [Geobacteraceae bacterium]|nr:ATPase, T2SS/T4P/T4SS family [Geobacteraceae bacterium]